MKMLVAAIVLNQYTPLQSPMPDGVGTCWLQQQYITSGMTRICEYGCERGGTIEVVPADQRCRPSLERERPWFDD